MLSHPLVVFGRLLEDGMVSDPRALCGPVFAKRTLLLRPQTAGFFFVRGVDVRSFRDLRRSRPAPREPWWASPAAGGATVSGPYRQPEAYG